MPVCIEWPDDFYRDIDKDLYFVVKNKYYDWTIVGLEMNSLTDDALVFKLFVEDEFASQLELTIQDGKARYITKSGPVVMLKQGRIGVTAEMYFIDNPLIVRFADTSFLK